MVGWRGIKRFFDPIEDDRLFGLDLNVHGVAEAWHDRIFAEKMLPRRNTALTKPFWPKHWRNWAADVSNCSNSALGAVTFTP